MSVILAPLSPGYASDDVNLPGALYRTPFTSEPLAVPVLQWFKFLVSAGVLGSVGGGTPVLGQLTLDGDAITLDGNDIGLT